MLSNCGVRIYFAIKVHASSTNILVASIEKLVYIEEFLFCAVLQFCLDYN